MIRLATRQSPPSPQGAVLSQVSPSPPHPTCHPHLLPNALHHNPSPPPHVTRRSAAWHQLPLARSRVGRLPQGREGGYDPLSTNLASSPSAPVPWDCSICCGQWLQLVSFPGQGWEQALWWECLTGGSSAVWGPTVPVQARARAHTRIHYKSWWYQPTFPGHCCAPAWCWGHDVTSSVDRYLTHVFLIWCWPL